MITKERLEELIRQEATIYNIQLEKVEKIELKNKTFFDEDERRDVYYCYDSEMECLELNYDDETNCYAWLFNQLYETKEEAEFVARNHDTEIIEFKPPFDFKESKEYYFNTKNGKGSIVYNNYGLYKVDYVGDSYYANHNFSDYQDAVDYAHKLFKGEE